MTAAPTLQALLEGPAGLDEAGRNAVAAHLDAAPRDPTPWYLKIPVALGAWVAAFFLCFFLGGMVALLGGFSEGLLFVVGVMTVTAAVSLHHMAGEGLFLGQLSLALSGGGHLAVLAAVGIMFRSFDPVPVFAVILCAALYLFHTAPVHRFLSVLSVQLTVFAWLVSHDASAMAHASAAAFALAAAFLLTAWPLAWEHRPAVLSLAFGSCATVLMALEYPGHGWARQASVSLSPWISAALLAGGFVALLAWHAGGRERLGRMPYSIAVTVLVGLVAVGSPGILLGLGLLVVGFIRRDTALTTLGLLFLPVFLSHYYYSLGMDLYTKSFLLLGSGVALLLARLALPRQPSTPFPEEVTA